ncbi:MAG TPA: Zn-dependent hydrolase [Steroidobacteraceae bacterium]|nr:Zn-dependent hydrolase [Steroidobacteraceae bacterium]
MLASTAAILLTLPIVASAKPPAPAVNADRLNAHLAALSRFGTNPEGGVSRVAYSDFDVAGRAYVTQLMKDAGLTVRVDAAGNLIGRLEGRNPKLPAIVLGSHTDSVPSGGNYDGDVGVLGAIEVAQRLHEAGVALRHPLEIVNFTDEEGSMIGSLAIVGHIKPGTLDQVSHSGKTVRDGVRAVGGDPEQLPTAQRRAGELAAYVELHIEQGAILEESKIDIGVVEGIVGIRRWDVTVHGFANHAGTTPMNRRHDALVSASDFVLAVSRVATTLPGRQVATVGVIKAEPGAPNVIPGKVTMTLEIRDLDEAKMQQVFDAIRSKAGEIATARETPIDLVEIPLGIEPAPTHEAVRQIVATAAKSLGLSSKFMPSGAAHDAQHMTYLAPTGMIFVPSIGGISHSPKEYTAPEAVANGANVLLRTVLAIDGGALGPADVH